MISSNHSQSIYCRIKRLRLFYILVISTIVLVLGGWLAFHPKSPLVKRNTFNIVFEQIGSLKKGDDVLINGVERGFVQDLKLFQGEKIDSVMVTIEVLADVKVPIDSKFKVENIGLMGKRVVQVALGQSKKFASSDIQFSGSFDYGYTRLAYTVHDIIAEVDSIVNKTDRMLEETIFDEENQNNIKDIATGIKRIDRRFNKITDNVLADVDSLYVQLNMISAKYSKIKNDINPKLDGILEDAEALKVKVDQLKTSSDEFSEGIVILREQFNDSTVAIGKMLKSEHYSEKIRDAVKTGKRLHESMRKKGLDLILDVF